MTALDRSETAYRYQPLFADALRAELRRREPGQPRRAPRACERLVCGARRDR